MASKNTNHKTLATKRAEQVSKLYADGIGMEPAIFLAMVLVDMRHYAETHRLNYQAIDKRAQRVFLSEKGE